MDKNRLVKHYNEKYFINAEKSTKIIPYLPIPTNRYEACLHYVPKYFRSGNILELGAGNGIIARSLLASNLEIHTYTASEFTELGTNALRNSVSDSRAQVIQLDAENFPEDGLDMYDAILMIAVIEHQIDPLCAMQRLRMLLKPGGFVYIDTPNIAKFTRRIKLLFGQFPSTASKNEGLTNYDGTSVDLYDEGHLHYFTYRSLTKMLIDRCQFSRIEKFGLSTTRVFGKTVDQKLACLWPEMFSELVIIAYG